MNEQIPDETLERIKQIFELPIDEAVQLVEDESLDPENMALPE